MWSFNTLKVTNILISLGSASLNRKIAKKKQPKINKNYNSFGRLQLESLNKVFVPLKIKGFNFLAFWGQGQVHPNLEGVLIRITSIYKPFLDHLEGVPQPHFRKGGLANEETMVMKTTGTIVLG